MSVIAKLLLGELERPLMVSEATSKRVKECKIRHETERYVKRELFKAYDPLYKIK
jgi:hypothetical protein